MSTMYRNYHGVDLRKGVHTYKIMTISQETTGSAKTLIEVLDQFKLKYKICGYKTEGDRHMVKTTITYEVLSDIRRTNDSDLTPDEEARRAQMDADMELIMSPALKASVKAANLKEDANVARNKATAARIDREHLEEAYQKIDLPRSGF